MAKYNSCKWIEHGIILDFLNKVRFCSNINPIHGGKPLIYENYRGEKINWDEFFKKTKEIKKNFKEGKLLKECKDCIGFEYKEWDEENYIDNLHITPWFKCNSDCVYCGLPRDQFLIRNTIDYSILPFVEDIIEKNILIKDAVIDIAGGEPTINPEFEKMLNLFIDNGYKNIIIHTNAINHSKALEKGIKQGVVNTLVSIDAGTKEVHEKVKRVKTFDKVWKNLTLYAKAQTEECTQVKAKFIIVPGINDSEKEINAWLEKCSNINIKYVVLNLDFNWLDKNIENKDRLQHLYNLMQYTKTRAKELELECELYGQIFQVKSIIENKVEQNHAGFTYNKK